MAQELSGIYLRTDIDRFFVFDSVEAELLSRDESGVDLQIRNPTRFDARVSILAENGVRARRPLDCTAMLKWPKVEIKSGAVRTLRITGEGEIK
jgi:hypothetical protein